MNNHQLALRTPGIKPWSANLRKQMRQIPNLRYTARGRPHKRQRFSRRELYFGSSFALAILDLLATELRVLCAGSLWLCFRIFATEWQAKCSEQLATFVVCATLRANGDVHSLHAEILIWIQLGEHQLFGQAQAVVAVAIEGIWIQSAEVAHAG